MATAEVKKIRGIVIRQSDAKETAAVVTAINEEGLFSFFAHGIKKMGGKNAAGCSLLSYSEFSVSESGSGTLTLKEASPLQSYLQTDSFDSCVCESLLVEMASRLVQEDEAPKAYPWFIGALQAIHDGKDPYTATLIAMAHFLELCGIGLQVNECVICGGKERISGVSYEEGGFVCHHCFDPSAMEKSPDMVLKILRYIFKAPLSDFGRVSLDRDFALRVARQLIQYIDEMTGTKLRSFDVLYHS